MCEKREMENDLVYNGIDRPVTVKCEVEPPTPKRRRIIIRCDEEEDEDDKEESGANEFIEHARHPPVFPVQEEANSPMSSAETKPRQSTTRAKRASLINMD